MWSKLALILLLSSFFFFLLLCSSFFFLLQRQMRVTVGSICAIKAKNNVRAGSRVWLLHRESGLLLQHCSTFGGDAARSGDVVAPS